MDQSTALPTELATLELATSPGQVRDYAELTADFNPIHVDAAFAARSPFGQPIAHGTMTLNLILEAAARSLGARLRRPELAVRFVKPLPVGAVARAGGRLSDAATGRYDVYVETADGVRTIEGTLTIGV